MDDALTPPEAGAADDGEGDELLFTTPLRLLRVIDLALARVRLTKIVWLLPRTC